MLHCYKVTMLQKSPYYCLGLVDYVKSHGDRPMTITWAMQNRIPGFILDKAQKMAVG